MEGLRGTRIVKIRCISPFIGRSRVDSLIIEVVRVPLWGGAKK